jgi:hypothetical protein
VNRGAVARKSVAGTSRWGDQCPLKSPRESTPYAVDPDPELATGGQDLVLDGAREQRVLDLKVGDRMGGLRSADPLRTGLREPHVADVASLHHFADRANGLLDGHRGVDPTDPVDVQVVGPQPAEGVRERALHGRWAAVDPDHLAVGSTQEPELHADRDLFAVATPHRPADQQLVVPGPVVVAGVEQRDAGVQRGVDRGDALGLVGRAVEVRHPHATEADRRDAKAGRAERAQVHRILPSANRIPRMSVAAGCRRSVN